MRPEDVAAALTVYVGEEELRKKTRTLGDTGLSAAAVTVAQGAWCAELERVQANAGVAWRLTMRMCLATVFPREQCRRPPPLLSAIRS
jgi:hypothetical protein